MSAYTQKICCLLCILLCSSATSPNSLTVCFYESCTVLSFNDYQEFKGSITSATSKLQSDFPKKLNLLKPIAKSDFKYISSRFGWRIHPIRKKRQFHKGIDIVTHSPTAPVFAAAKGIVVAIQLDPKKPQGLAISIQHPFNVKTKYAHLSKILVRQGQIVNAGQQIGIIGNTGHSTATHLHYEIWSNGQAVNPLNM